MITSVRKELCLNGLWDFKCVTDNNWSKIQVPGCYSLNRTQGKWARYYWDCFNYPDEWLEKAATYKKQFFLPTEMEGMNISFCCKGCFYHSKTYINEHFLGSFHDGYYPFEYDITPFLKEGENEIVIEVEETKPFTNGGESDQNRGIWKDTYLYAYSHTALEYGAHIETSLSSGTIAFNLPIRNYLKKKRNIIPKISIEEQDGIQVLNIDGGLLTLDPEETKEHRVISSWDNPHLWFPHDPHLYQAHVRLFNEEGALEDHYQLRFGFREIRTEKHHILLNERELYLRGHGGHYCGDLQGSKEYAVQWIKALKERGVNFMRMHVNPRHDCYFEAADELGFLIEAEAAYHFQVPAEEKLWKEHIGHMVRNQRNHPSVIIWSISNELRWNGGGEKPEIIKYTQSLDSTRPVFASDFSLCSTHGDLLGHHYNADTVYEEWEEFGPDKPMLWDELGNVWQPDRPLRNGTAGYEVTSQDYATGLWRDGHDDMLADIKLMSKGKEINGQWHRVNGFIPWDLSYCFFRFQPTNNHSTLILNHKSLEGPGTKQKQIPSCSSTVNIWDRELPLFEPNPGFYFFNKYLLPVRIFDNTRISNLFGGSQLTLFSRIEYDDLRYCDSIIYTIEDRSHNLLFKDQLKIDLIPGQIVDNVRFDFQVPRVEKPLEVRISRTFTHDHQKGWNDSLSAKIFPLPGSLEENTEEEIRIRHEITDEDHEFVARGGRILCLSRADIKEGSPRILLNGVNHAIIEALDQRDFAGIGEKTFTGGLIIPPQINVRNILAGDKHGKTSCLYEKIEGKGCILFTSLDLKNTADPLGAYLLTQCLKYLSNYKCHDYLPNIKFMGDLKESSPFAETGIEFSHSKEGSRPDIIIIEGSRDINDDDQKQIKNLLREGGTIFVDRLAPENRDKFSDIIGKKLLLTSPYREETNHVIKAAISYTRSHTPEEWVEYYDKYVIPQPFEANYHPLLSGISNWDLQFKGKAFDWGIEVEGMNPIIPHEEVTMLLCNWRIDWSQPLYGGEYIQESKDIRRADWFINRNALLLEVMVGPGRIFFNQLDFTQSPDQGKAFFSKLFTHLGIPLGGKNFFNDSPYSNKKREDQIDRFKKRKIAPVTRRDQNPWEDKKISQSDNQITKILLMGDPYLKHCVSSLNEELTGWGEAEYAQLPVSTTMDAENILKNIYGLLDNRKWQVVYLSLVQDNENISPEKRESNNEMLESIIEILIAMNIKVFWGAASPVKNDLCYFHDMGEPISDLKLSDSSLALNDKDVKMISRQIAQAVRYFGM
jgi:hypothetical protein